LVVLAPLPLALDPVLLNLHHHLELPREQHLSVKAHLPLEQRQPLLSVLLSNHPHSALHPLQLPLPLVALAQLLPLHLVLRLHLLQRLALQVPLHSVGLEQIRVLHRAPLVLLPLLALPLALVVPLPLPLELHLPLPLLLELLLPLRLLCLVVQPPHLPSAVEVVRFSAAA
jgi:hypothetical protein